MASVYPDQELRIAVGVGVARDPGDIALHPRPDLAGLAEVGFADEVELLIEEAVGPRVDPRDPLVVIEYVTPDPLYRDPLRYAIRAAEGRGRSIQYDVIAVVSSVDGAEAGQQRALGVMRAIMQDRVPASRVHLGLRIDPSIPAPRVLVYVR